MSEFTYEREDLSSALETYEWNDVWWEQTQEHERKRVLYIGDSISCGLRRVATNCSGEKILFDGFGTSKAVDNPFLADSVRLFGMQQGKRDLVIFNNGLHGFHLEDATEYKEYYEKMVCFLLEEYQDTPIALVLTTCIEGERNQRVEVRNQSAREIAQKYELPIIDLYQASVEHVSLRSEDGVHFTAEGYEKLAQVLLDSIYKIVPAMNPQRLDKE